MTAAGARLPPTPDVGTGDAAVRQAGAATRAKDVTDAALVALIGEQVAPPVLDPTVSDGKELFRLTPPKDLSNEDLQRMDDDAFELLWRADEADEAEQRPLTMEQVADDLWPA